MTEPRRFTARNDFSRWLNEVIELLLSELSLGGWAALCHAMDYQDKISGVIALAPTGIVKPRFSFLPKVLFYSLRGEKGIRNLMGLMSEGGRDL